MNAKKKENGIVRLYKSIFEKPYVYSPDEEKIVVLLDKILNSPSTKIFMSPISSNYYMIKGELGDYKQNSKILLNGKTLKAVIPGNNFFKDLSEKFGKILIDTVEAKIEEDRAKIYQSIIDSELALLDEIIGKFAKAEKDQISSEEMEKELEFLPTTI